MRLRSRISLLLAAFGCVPLLLVAIYSHFTITGHLQNQELRALEAVAASKQNAVIEAIDGWNARVRLIASRTQLRAALRANNEGDELAVEVIRRIVRDAVTSEQGVVRVLVRNLQGEVIAEFAKPGYAPQAFRLPRPTPKPVTGNLPLMIALTHTADGQPAVEYETPLQLEGRRIGSLDVLLRADSLIRISTDYTGLGETGESIVLVRLPNGDALFIAPLRHDPEAAFRRSIPASRTDIPAVSASQSAQIASYDRFIDYRGIPVIAATRPLAEIGGGVVAKIDRAEADAGIRTVLRAIGMVVPGVLLLSVLLGVLLSKPVVRPIQHLAEVVGRIREGDLQARARISGDAEVSALASDINRMAAALQVTNTRLMQSEKQFRSAFDDAAIGMALVGLDGSWIKVNDALCRILGYSREELLETDFQSITHPADVDQDESLLHQALDGKIKVYSMNKRYLHKNGNIVYARLNVSLLRDKRNKPRFFISQIEDITGEYLARAELERTVRKLELSNEELEEFAYTASHDLKEPLRTLSNFSQFLEDDYAGKLDGDGRGMLRMMREAATRLEGLIDVLLRYSRAGRDGVRRSEIDLSELVDEIRIELGAALAESNVEIRVAQPVPRVSGDPVLVNQILQNLISNSICYRGPENLLVEVGVRAGGSSPVIYVQDNGIGIPEQHHKKIFRIFKRLHARDEFGGGEGAGLTIVKKLVEAHGGEIWVESEEGHGACFCFTLEESGPAQHSHDVQSAALTENPALTEENIES